MFLFFNILYIFFAPFDRCRNDGFSFFLYLFIAAFVRPKAAQKPPHENLVGRVRLPCGSERCARLKQSNGLPRLSHGCSPLSLLLDFKCGRFDLAPLGFGVLWAGRRETGVTPATRFWVRILWTPAALMSFISTTPDAPPFSKGRGGGRECKYY